MGVMGDVFDMMFVGAGDFERFRHGFDFRGWTEAEV